MTTTISSTTVATPKDLQILEEKLDQIGKLVRQVNKDARARSEENASRIRILQSDLKAQEARADKLEANLKNLKKTLNGIAEEVDHSTSLLDKVSDHLSESGSVLDQVIASAREQTQTEVARRQELTESLEQLLDQYKAQATALHQAFADIQSNLTELTRAEQDGARSIEYSIRELREALVQLQSRTQEDLTRTAETVQDFIHAKEERAHQEETAFDQLLTVQECLQERLEAIQSAADGLSASSVQAQKNQQTRLMQTMAWHTQELNHQAALLLHRSDYQAAILLLEEAARLVPEDTTIQTNLALACLKAESSQRERAEGLLVRVLEQNPQAVIALNGLGVLYLDRADPQASLPHLQRAAQLAPDDAVIWLNLGKAHYGCGSIAPAFDAWHQARQLEPLVVANDAVVKILLEEQEILHFDQNTTGHLEV